MLQFLQTVARPLAATLTWLLALHWRRALPRKSSKDLYSRRP
jgi:hypothetical protein